MGSRAESGKCKGLGCTWDSLRNSAGEKMLQLRSHPLGTAPDCTSCSLLTDLSLEQRFDVSYLDLGEKAVGAGAVAGVIAHCSTQQYIGLILK
jgi:RISC-loading complex subunit TARBP2